MFNGNINDAELQKFMELAGQMGVRVFMLHGDGWLPQVENEAALPATGNIVGDIRQALDTGVPYRWNGTTWGAWSTSGASWGSIGGTLGSQTDLQNALNAKMGAGAYVLVSEDSALANQINLGSLSTGLLKISTSGGVATFSIGAKADVGLGNVDNTSDANKPVSTAQAAADTTVLNTAKAYAESLVVGLLDDRGNWNASGNAYPTTGGSGTAGAILKGDLWTISASGTLGTKAVTTGDVLRALVDSPGQTEENWVITENNIGYVAENSANKATTMTGNTASDTKYLSAKAVYDWANPLIAAKALDSDVVKLTGNETIDGLKSFSSGQIKVLQDASLNSTIFHTNGTQNWYVGLRGDQSNVYSVANDGGDRFSVSPLGVITIRNSFYVLTETLGDTELGLTKADSNAWWSKNRFVFQRYRGTLGAKQATQSGDVIGAMAWRGYDGTNNKDFFSIEVRDNGARGRVLMSGGDIEIDHGGSGYALTTSGKINASGGLVVGNHSNAIAGITRWTGTKLQVYTGSAWVDLH